METTTYKCDRCGAEDTNNKIRLQQIGVHVGRYNQSYNFANKESYSQDWCYDCRVLTRMSRPDPNPDKPTPVPEPLTLEDLVREIVRKEISQS